MNQGQKTAQKLIFLITRSNWGGAQRYVYDLATNLPKAQFEAKVVLGGTGTADAKVGVLAVNLEQKGIPTIWVTEFMRDISFARDFTVYKLLVEIFKKENPDVVHLNSSKAGGIGALAARRVGVKKIIFTVHGWPFLEDRSLISRAFIWFATWITVLLCTKVICISDYDLKIGQKMPFLKDKFVRIYNGIAYMNLQDGHEIREKFPAGAKITGTIGELTHNKNQISLIERAKNDPNMYVAIVGFGEDWAMLENKIKQYDLNNRVHLFGFMQVERALKGFDTFALPSLKEGLPYVLLEARQAGIPIEANRVGGVAEILDAKDMSEFSLERMVEKTRNLY